MAGLGWRLCSVQTRSNWAVNQLTTSIGHQSPEIGAHTVRAEASKKMASRSFKPAKILVRGLPLPQPLHHLITLRVLPVLCLSRELVHGPCPVYIWYHGVSDEQHRYMGWYSHGVSKVSVEDAAGVKQVRAVIECLRQQMRELMSQGVQGKLLIQVWGYCST